MVSARAYRLFASILAVLAGMGVPGTAVAHGFAHAREKAPGHHAVSTGPHTHHPAGRTIGDAEHSGDGHAHPQLDRGTAIRFADHGQVAAAPEIAPAFSVTTVIRETVVVAAARPRADPAHAPPPLPRSPPLS